MENILDKNASGSKILTMYSELKKLDKGWVKKEMDTCEGMMGLQVGRSTNEARKAQICWGMRECSKYDGLHFLGQLQWYTFIWNTNKCNENYFPKKKK